MGKNRRVKPVSQTAKYLSKRRILSLAIVWLGIIVMFVVLLIMFICQASYESVTLVAILMAFANFGLLFSLKGKIAYYAMRHGYQMLLDYCKEPVIPKYRFDNAWLEHLTNSNFEKAAVTDSFDIYYRYVKPIDKRLVNSGKVLEIISIVKRANLDLYDTSLEDEYKKINDRISRKDKIYKQIVFQFKKYPTLDDSAKDELNSIICYREGRYYLITINVGYIEDIKKIYYLHSDRYAPNMYYWFAANEVKELC